MGQLQGEGAAALSRLDRRVLLDALGGPVFLCDVETGRVLDANADGWALLGGRGERAREPSLADWSAQDAGYTAARARCHLQRALASGSERFAWVCRRANGSRFSAEVRAVRAAHSGVSVADGLVVVVVRDTSAEQQVREALRVAEERYFGLVQNLPRAAIVLLDRDMRMLLVDGPEVENAGFSKAEMEGKLISEALPPDVAEPSKRYIRRALDGEHFSTELSVGDLWYICHYLPIRAEAGDIPYALALCVNVTDERRALEKLRSSEEHLARIVETAPDPMSILREQDSVITYVNPAFETTFGWSSADIVGRATTEVALWDDPEQRLAVLAEFRQNGRVDSRSIAARTRSGELVEGLLSLRAIEVGGVPCILTSFRDISELRRAETERTHLLGELRARNSEMEQFAYTVSHDLKSPLVTITGFLGAIERDLRDGRHERVMSDIRRIRSAASKMSTLLDDLLQLSRVGRVGGPLEPVPLGELAREAAELVAGALDAGHVELEIAADLPVVHGDRGRLLQLLQNLFDNAAKYSRGAQPPRIELGWREEGEFWLLFVRDNGMGVPPEYAARIFGLFEKLDPKSPGTGIGLALARRIIEFHGGRIWVESDGQRGSTFFFTLPRRPVAAGARPGDARVT